MRRKILWPCVISSVPILLELINYENLPRLFKTTNWSITLKQVLFTYNSFKSLQQEINIAKGITDPGVDYFKPVALIWFCGSSLVGLAWFSRLSLVGLVK